MKKPSKIIVITGATQGLGYALAEWFCEHYGDGAKVYLTGRLLADARTAVDRLRKKGFLPIAAQLDVTQQASIDAFVASLTQKGEGVDVLISNAAARITPDKPEAEQVATFIDTNNHGAYRILTAFKQLLRDQARVVVVASSFGSLRNLPKPLHKYFDVSKAALRDIDNVMSEYALLVQDGEAQKAGWPEWINVPSKVGQVASVKVFARENKAEFKKRGIIVNAACPGLMDTGASRPWFKDMSGAATPRAAAPDVAWLATLPPNNATNPGAELLQHRRALPWA